MKRIAEVLDCYELNYYDIQSAHTILACSSLNQVSTRVVVSHLIGFY